MTGSGTLVARKVGEVLEPLGYRVECGYELIQLHWDNQFPACPDETRPALGEIPTAAVLMRMLQVAETTRQQTYKDYGGASAAAEVYLDTLLPGIGAFLKAWTGAQRFIATIRIDPRTAVVDALFESTRGKGISYHHLDADITPAPVGLNSRESQEVVDIVPDMLVDALKARDFIATEDSVEKYPHNRHTTGYKIIYDIRPGTAPLPT